jgi:glycine cleavage system H protein
VKEVFREYGDQFWVSQEDNIYTIGLTEDSLNEIDEIQKIELPSEGDIVDKEVAVGVIHTSNGQIEIYAPLNGEIAEINSTVIEDPSLVLDDPYDSWLIKIESDEILETEDEDEEDDDDDDFDEEDFEEEEVGDGEEDFEEED